jgi:hypothetical protein
MVKIRRVPPTAGQKVSVSDLIALIPPYLTDQLANDLQADKWVRKLKADALFKLVLFSLLNSERLSLRVMEDNFQDPFFKALAPALSADEVTWAGIRDRLIKLDSTFSRKLYEAIYERAQHLYGSKTLAGYHIKRYDSTMIATFSHLLQGMKVGNTGKGKTQVKLTTELKDDFLIQLDFHKDQAYLSEETALKEAILKSPNSPNDISVFDKGLKSRKTFGQLDENGTLFVGRLHGEPRYKLLYPHWENDGTGDTEELEFVQDSVVHLYESGTETLKRDLRMIQFRRKQDAQLLSFVTNVWDVPAHVVAQIYRHRWDIEVLFRFMKQEMNLTHFVSNDTNAIQNMLYFTMITAMLVLIYKKRNGIKSYKAAKVQFFKELFYSVMIDALESPEGVEWIKKTMKKFVHRE